MNPHREARILVVDDDEVILGLLEHLLREAGYANLLFTPDPREVEMLYQAFAPDLVLLDLELPHRSGMQVLRDLRRLAADEAYLPLVVLSGDASPEARWEVLGHGAADFLAKPFDGVEVVSRVHSHLGMRFLCQALQAENRRLAERVRELEGSAANAAEPAGDGDGPAGS